ncbi:hypothetical protein QAD02_024093 [Eretmocerus hayati]|uniref:Uncharacterized protein n=1 Tax=Eretmocerus hayati TaxID=131215 RepID=A0ACC2PXS4_9HYME|nr:hypothetical protein QAD02_024093 [Eretmocerus hayati]
MGICDRRMFLLSLCSLQIITTAERQVFDFLGSMWMPILFNFFNIILVILGFFGGLQYRHRYIISYCVWNALWLMWNIFLTCFYLNAAGLDKNSDLLNLGTGSFSWWYVNGPGCKAHFNTTFEQPEFGRPLRPDEVTGCVLDYEIIEVIHSSIQCFSAIVAVITGILVCRAFLEEDDSFDFVGGGEFGMAGHTPLHPMYVSYSALPPAYAMHNKQQGDPGYYYPTNTATTTTGSSHRSSSTTLVSPPASDYPSYDRPSHNRGPALPPPAAALHRFDQQRDSEQMYRHVAYGGHQPQYNESENRSRQRAGRPYQPPPSLEFADYSSPIDQLPQIHHQQQQQQYQQRGGGRLDYDTLETHTPNLGQNRHRLQPRQVPQPQQPPTYSPLASRSRHANRAAASGAAVNSTNNRISYRPRVYADLIREQQAPGGLRSFLSDPRLAGPEQQQQQQQNHGPTRRDAQGANNRRHHRGSGDAGAGRPLSMFVSNYEQHQQHYGGR